MLRADGHMRRSGQPGLKHPFWTAVTHWHQQGRQVKDGLCVWAEPPKDELVHLGGSNYALKGSALAEKFKAEAAPASALLVEKKEI